MGFILQNNFFYDIGEIENLHNLTVLFGGRGVGKTYSALKHLISEGYKFIWLRDTKEICDTIIAGESLTAPIEFDDPSFPHVEIIQDKKIGKFIKCESKEKEDIAAGECIGYLMSLSTFKNARGVDFSDVKIIAMDEFVPEEGTIVREHTGTTFLNMYETVNRNRELKGFPPVKILLMSNTTNIYSDILIKLGISDIIENMVVEKQNTYKNSDIYIEFIKNENFAKAKNKTFLYRIANDSKFKKSAIDNEFTESRARIKKYTMKGFKPICKLNNEYVLLQNEKLGVLYWKRGNYKNVQNYDMDDDQQALLYRFLFTDHLRTYYISGKMYFDSIYTQREILRHSKIK